MPVTYGPFTTSTAPAIVAGSAMAISIDRAAQWIQIHNDSPYRLYFQLDGPQPTASDSRNGQYVGMAAPWAHPVIPVQRTAATYAERSLNAIKDFQGTLWVMVTDPTVNLAQTGTVSSLVEIHIDVYYPGERIPDAWAIPRQQDMTSQPRVVAVPMGLAHWNTGRWLSTDGATKVLTTLTPTAAQLAVSRLPIYLYYANVASEANSSAGVSFSIEIQWQTAGGANVGAAFPLAMGAVSANNTSFATTNWVLAPLGPIAYIGGQGGNIPPTAAKGIAQMTQQAGGARCNMTFTIAIWADPTNVIGDADIGVQTLYGGLGLGNPLF